MPHPTLGDPNLPCARTIDLPGGSLGCLVHPGPTYPWSPQRGCSLPVASVCAVCIAAEVPIDGRFSWSFVCRACTRLDAAIARPLGATALTPTRGQSGCEAGTLFAALFPDRVARTTTSLRPGPRPAVTSVTHQPADPWLPRLVAHSRERLKGLAAASGLTGVVPWATWAGAHPGSPQVRAEAYGAYVRAVHPWVLSVEPRVEDVGWLAHRGTDT